MSSVVWLLPAAHAMSQDTDGGAPWGEVPDCSAWFVFRFAGGSPRGSPSDGGGQPSQHRPREPGWEDGNPTGGGGLLVTSEKL